MTQSLNTNDEPLLFSVEISDKELVEIENHEELDSGKFINTEP